MFESLPKCINKKYLDFINNNYPILLKYYFFNVVKKYINEVTISASSPSSRDCATPSSPSALNQVSSSTVSQNDLPQVENQDEVDQVKFVAHIKKLALHREANFYIFSK